MADRDEFVRESMRRLWTARTADYAEAAAGHAAHTRMLIQKAAPRPGERVLDVATGPGAAALAAAEAVGPSGRVLATDFVPQWGEAVARACAEAGLSNVEFRAMDAQALDLPDGSFDLVLCQLGLMFVPQPLRALREMGRVLRDGGRLAIAVWSTAERVPHHGLAGQIFRPYAPPPAPPEQRLPTPVSLGEPGLIERLVREADFRDIAADRQVLEQVYESPEAYWRTISGSGQGRAVLDALSPEQREQVHREALARVEPYRRGERLYFPSEAIYVTAAR